MNFKIAIFVLIIFISGCSDNVGSVFQPGGSERGEIENLLKDVDMEQFSIFGGCKVSYIEADYIDDVLDTFKLFYKDKCDFKLSSENMKNYCSILKSGQYGIDSINASGNEYACSGQDITKYFKISTFDKLKGQELSKKYLFN